MARGERDQVLRRRVSRSHDPQSYLWPKPLRSFSNTSLSRNACLPVGLQPRISKVRICIIRAEREAGPGEQELAVGAIGDHPCGSQRGFSGETQRLLHGHADGPTAAENDNTPSAVAVFRELLQPAPHTDAEVRPGFDTRHRQLACGPHGDHDFKDALERFELFSFPAGFLEGLMELANMLIAFHQPGQSMRDDRLGAKLIETVEDFRFAPRNARLTVLLAHDPGGVLLSFSRARVDSVKGQFALRPV